MAITRTYTTELECARLWVNETFDCIPADLVTCYLPDYAPWHFVVMDEHGQLCPADPPLWGTYFHIGDNSEAHWFEDNARAIARLGFTLIYEDTELWGLGIDGGGYSFHNKHWVPLYRLRGLTWHLPEENVSED